MTAKAWKSKRMTNPLDPTYTVWENGIGEFGKKLEMVDKNEKYGTIPGARSTGLPKAVAGVRNLSTQDIGGAQANTRGKGAFNWYERR